MYCKLLSSGTYKYMYDADGNMTSQTNIATGAVTYYTWDYRNRLIEVKQESSTGTLLNDEKFTYDVFNNRIAVSLNGTPQLYTVYDGSNPYLDFNGSGQLTERYLYNPNALSQFYGQVNASGNVQWFLTDNINSVRQVVSAGGTVLDAITYDPYGNILSQTNASNAPRFLYAGGAYDTITGQYQFGRRYYAPTDGRWASQDSLGFAAGDTDLYRYVYNDPANARDPSGLWSPPSWFSNGLYNIGKGFVEVPAIIGDLGQAAYAGIYMTATGKPYVPNWWSMTANAANNAWEQDHINGINNMLWQHWTGQLWWNGLQSAVLSLVYDGDPAGVEQMIGGMLFMQALGYGPINFKATPSPGSIQVNGIGVLTLAPGVSLSVSGQGTIGTIIAGSGIMSMAGMPQGDPLNTDPTPPDIIAEELNFDQIQTHGDPGNWTYLGQKCVPATGRGFPPGTQKIYEVFLDEFGKQVEWHYWIMPDGTIYGGKFVPNGTTSLR
jgi:RHS repeat-associated protein